MSDEGKNCIMGIVTMVRSIWRLPAAILLLSSIASAHGADPAWQRTSVATLRVVTLDAAPAAGSAPLTVHFSGTAWTGHSFDPGDGTIQDTIESGYLCGGVPGNVCIQEHVAVRYNHIYKRAGTFTAILRTQEPGAPKGSASAAKVVVAK